MTERDVAIRTGEPEELPAVMNVLDGALLQTDAAAVGDRLQAGEVLVAMGDDAVLGACVLAPGDLTTVAAIAVRHGRRDAGIGRALLQEASVRYGRLEATFDGRVRGFYEAVGFDIEPDGDRYRGVWEG